MFDWFQEFAKPALYDVLKAFLGAFSAFIIAAPLRTWWQRRRFGGWAAVVTKDGNEVVRREIGTRKLMSIREDESDLSVFLKGIVSPYARVNVDLVTEGKRIGLLTVHVEPREYIINLDKNPPAQTQDPLSVE